MYIPPAPATSGRVLQSLHVLATNSSSSQSPIDSERWSSLIGIVTAIIGNILISFALNTQRYAHMRLRRDQDEKEEKSQKVRRLTNGKSYGTQEGAVAEVRARQNGKAGLEDGEEVDERAPLIPRVGSVESDGGDEEDRESSEDEEEGEKKEKSYLKSPIWWVGIALMTVGEAGNFLAYGFAPASIVSPLGVVALISNCLIAPLLLHERFRWRDGMGVLIAVAGCVTVVLSASDSNPRLDPDSMWHLITRWEFETYLGITVFLIIVLMAVSNKFGDRTILIDLGLVGLFGGYTALSTKGVASLLSNTIWRVFTFPITYLLVAVLVVTAVMQIKYVNRALQRFDSTMVIPTQFVMFTLSVIIGSAILYQDFKRTDAQQAITFVGGCALTFLGVWFITSGRDKHDDEDEEEEVAAEGADGINLVDEERRKQEIREREDGEPFIRASSSKSAPASKLLRSDGALSPSKPPQRLPINPEDLTPAKAAAIHDHTASNLPVPNIKSPPQLHATTSAPEVPTIECLSPSPRPKTPKRFTAHPAIETPTKPSPPATPQPRRQPPDQLDPNTAATSASARLLNRHSIAGLVPGPLTSPLSSSLSAIVADSLRRGVDRPTTGGSGSVRRRSLRRGGSRRDPNAAVMKRHSIASGEMDFPGNGGDERSGSVQGRMRSLSAAVGDIFGGMGVGSGSGVGRRKSVQPDGRGDQNAEASR